MTGNRVVLQVRADEPPAVLDGTRTAKNLLAEVTDAQVDLVVQGGAVAGLTRDAESAADLQEIMGTMPALTVYACANALRAHGVAQDALAEGIEVAPAGVAHCAQRQWQGWAYVRV